MSTKPFLSDFQLSDWILSPRPSFWRTQNTTILYEKLDNYQGVLMRMIKTWLILVEFWDKSVLPGRIESDRTFRDLLLGFFQSGWVVHRISSDVTSVLQVPNVSGILSMENPYKPIIHFPNLEVTQELKIDSDINTRLPWYNDFLKKVENSIKAN